METRHIVLRSSLVSWLTADCVGNLGSRSGETLTLIMSSVSVASLLISSPVNNCLNINCEILLKISCLFFKGNELSQLMTNNCE